MSAHDDGSLVLTDHDRHSTTWQRLAAHLQARIDLLRRKNDNELSPEKTAALRGAIAELKNLLAAGANQD